jgi:hypothetical protein
MSFVAFESSVQFFALLHLQVKAHFFVQLSIKAITVQQESQTPEQIAQ